MQTCHDFCPPGRTHDECRDWCPSRAPCHANGWLLQQRIQWMLALMGVTPRWVHPLSVSTPMGGLSAVQPKWLPMCLTDILPHFLGADTNRRSSSGMGKNTFHTPEFPRRACAALTDASRFCRETELLWARLGAQEIPEPFDRAGSLSQWRRFATPRAHVKWRMVLWASSENPYHSTLTSSSGQLRMAPNGATTSGLRRLPEFKTECLPDCGRA